MVGINLSISCGSDRKLHQYTLQWLHNIKIANLNSILQINYKKYSEKYNIIHKSNSNKILHINN